MSKRPDQFAEMGRKFTTADRDPTRLNSSATQVIEDYRLHARRGGWLSSHAYNLTISHEYRLMWFRVAKVGTRTILEHLRKSGVPLACLAPRISRDEVEPLAQGIVAWHEEVAPAGDTTCVFRDSAFADDVAKTNLAAILEQHGIGKVRSL